MIGEAYIQPKCLRKTAGDAAITIRACTSNTTFLQTSCGGYCDSSAKATHGNNIYDSSCVCCSPTKVKQYTAYMKCSGSEPDFETKFNIIETCSCTVRTCSGNNDVGGVHISDESGVPVEKRRRRRR